jgi:hypothetical protein
VLAALRRVFEGDPWLPAAAHLGWGMLTGKSRT